MCAVMNDLLLLTVPPAVLQEWVFHGTRTPPAVMTENTAELADLTQNVLMYKDKDSDTDTDDVDTTLIMFVMCHQETTLAGSVTWQD